MANDEAQAILSLAAAQSPAAHVIIIRENYLYRSLETESQSVLDNASSWR